MNSDKIYKNNLFKKVIDNQGEFIKKNPLTKEDIKIFRESLGTEKIKAPQRKKEKISTYDRYNLNVFVCLTEIAKTLEDLHAVQIFLRQYPYSKTLKKNNITKVAYIAYHMEAYFVKAASLRDKLALLVNAIYDLGLPNEKAKLDLLSKMKQLKGSRVISLLKKFSKALKEISAQKNIIAHRAKYDDGHLVEIGMYEQMIGSGKKELDRQAAFVVEWKRSNYLRYTRKALKKNQIYFEEFLALFFTSVEKEFDRKCKSLNIN